MQSRINKIFKAIADPTRREIFHVLVLATTALSITQIAGQFNISRQGITKHIMLLHDAGMLEIESIGREKYCQANLSALNEIRDWLAFYDKFWDESLKNLQDFLDTKNS